MTATLILVALLSACGGVYGLIRLWPRNLPYAPTAIDYVPAVEVGVSGFLTALVLIALAHLVERSNEIRAILERQFRPAAADQPEPPPEPPLKTGPTEADLDRLRTGLRRGI